MTAVNEELFPDLSPAELDRLARWEQADEEQQAFRETVGGGKLYRFLEEGTKPNIADVARIMREGVEPPRMLLDQWLVEGELHWLFAEAEAGKTWLALYLSWEVMRAGGIVAYFDEELGENIAAERLVALGVPADLVETNFVYAPFPNWGADGESLARHADLMRTLRPQLVVYDTATDMLANADVDENSGKEVTAWVKAYPEVARRAGATQLVLDHVGLAAKDRVVGSRAKRAKAKVMYKLGRPTGAKKYSAFKTGEVVVTMNKNTRGADIPDRREFEIGGSPFQWTELGTAVASDSMRITAELTRLVIAEPGIKKTKLLKAVSGARDAMKGEILDQLVAGGQLVCRVIS